MLSKVSSRERLECLAASAAPGRPFFLDWIAARCNSRPPGVGCRPGGLQADRRIFPDRRPRLLAGDITEPEGPRACSGCCDSKLEPAASHVAKFEPPRRWRLC